MILKNSTHIIVLALLCSACYPDKDKKVDVNKLSFSTTDASELFFKNIRKSEYITEDMPQATLEVYRYKKPEQAHGLISPALVVNWGNDRAYLILEKSGKLSEELIFLIGDPSKADTIYFEGSQQLQHAEVAIRIYNALLDQRQVLLLEGGETLELFTDEERKLFRRIVFDFLRLVELQ